MYSKNPLLFLEINHSSYIFVAGRYTEQQKLEILETIITPNDGIHNKKFTNFDLAQNTIKNNIQTIEEKINYVFKDITLIIDNFDYSSLNISGFKKLNGSQVFKENISYILNSLKLVITECEKEKTILQIFNSKSLLDNVVTQNLPIGLFGNFYSHELTFFLINNNDLKNLKNIFYKNKLNIKKILTKDFIEGTEIIKHNDVEAFFLIKINENNSKISFFEQDSFKYVENFNFGTNIILKDIKKVCSIDEDIIEKMLTDQNFKDKKIIGEENLVDNKYFNKKNFRKIRKKLILDIVNSRVEELIDIMINKNINISSFKGAQKKIYLTIENQSIINNFSDYFLHYLSKNIVSSPLIIKNIDLNNMIISANEITQYGWKKEAVPIIQSKNSLITRIFKSIFG